MEAKFVAKDDFKAFLDNFKKEMDEWKDTNNENINKYNEIKKNQEKNDVITNKLVDKIVNLFKSKSDDNISKKWQNKELKNVIEVIKIKNQKVVKKRKKKKRKRIKKK